MDLFDFTITISQPVAMAGTCILLLHLTPLPIWGAILIALLLGAVLGVFIGIGLGIAIDFTFRKLGLITPSSAPKRRNP